MSETYAKNFIPLSSTNKTHTHVNYVLDNIVCMSFLFIKMNVIINLYFYRY